MNFQRLKRLDVWIVGAAMAVPLCITGAGVAQVQRVMPDGREVHRIERRVDALEKDYNTLKLDIEKRLAPIETYVKIAVALLTMIATAYAGQVTWMVAERRRSRLQAQLKNESNAA